MIILTINVSRRSCLVPRTRIVSRKSRGHRRPKIPSALDNAQVQKKSHLNHVSLPDETEETLNQPPEPRSISLTPYIYTVVMIVLRSNQTPQL